MKNILFLFLIFLVSGCSLQKTSTSTKTAETKTVSLVETKTDNSIFTIDTTKSANLDLTYTKVEYYEFRHSDTAKAMPVRQIKSVETLLVRKATVSKGETVIQKAIKNDSTTQTIATVNQEVKETVKPAPDPRRWMWIFGILLILFVAFIYLKRPNILPLTKTIFSKILKSD